MAKVSCIVTGQQLAHFVKVAKAFRPDPLVIRFGKDGIRMALVDQAEVAMMVYHVRESKLENYSVELPPDKEELEVHVDPQKLEAAAKVLAKPKVELSHDSNEARLNFKAGRVKRAIPTLVGDKTYRKELPKLTLESAFLLDGAEALDAMAKLETVSECIVLELKNNKVRFESGEYENVVEISYNEDEATPTETEAKSLYTTSYMACILSGVAGSEQVYFRFETDRPVLVSYANDTGDYQALAAPRIETD